VKFLDSPCTGFVGELSFRFCRCRQQVDSFSFAIPRGVGEWCAQSRPARRKGKSGQHPPAKPKQHETEARVQREERQTKAESTHLQRTFKSAEARIVCDFRQVTSCNSWDIRKFAPNIEIQKSMMTANEIREAFKRFFEENGHLIVPSAPMVIKDDPTLMFTNAGMNQFKDIILGNVEPKSRRMTDSQKCLRVSGKHNDLEEVGHDTYHHTMFEMLGNWSFGDYFKEGAITFAYKFLVEVLKIDPKDLYVTVFEGDKSAGLERDDEAAGIWERYFPKDHIINGNKHDNFWEMGDTGPCGPCSEIHIDNRTDAEKAAVPGAELVNKDNPFVIEIWNLVFMQYNRKADGSLEGLPHKVIDTGMGFERLVRVMQGKTSNYDTDVFQPIIRKIAELSGFAYGKDEPIDVAVFAFDYTEGRCDFDGLANSCDGCGKPGIDVVLDHL